jgi:hypothetical protein
VQGRVGVEGFVARQTMDDAALELERERGGTATTVTTAVAMRMFDEATLALRKTIQSMVTPKHLHAARCQNMT